jgi:hypothetical protein
VISEYASGRKTNPLERATFRAAAADPVVARALEGVISRRRSPLRALDPRLAPRLLRAGGGC